MRRSGAVILAVALGAASPGAAWAWCQSTTDASGCTTCDVTCQGIPIIWPSTCATYSINQAGTSDVPFADAEAAIQRSFDHWETPICSDGTTPYLRFTETAAATCQAVAYRNDAGNVDLIVWRESGWESDAFHPRAAIALTTVYYDTTNGNIYTANTELNGEFFTFTTTDVAAQVMADVENTMTHEAGHFHGLAHSMDSMATMFASSTLGDTSKRTLAQDDIDAICAVYPASNAPTGCALQPPGGLDLACLPPSHCGCAVPGFAHGASGATGALAVLLGLAGLVRRRRGSRS